MQVKCMLSTVVDASNNLLYRKEHSLLNTGPQKCVDREAIQNANTTVISKYKLSGQWTRSDNDDAIGKR